MILFMKQIIVDTLIFVFNLDKIIKFQKKKIKSLSELNDLTNKELMKLYNIVMQSENCKNFESIFIKDEQLVSEYFFREYMIDKLYEQKEAIDVVYFPDIEDEPDCRIISLYNHNMFEHGFIKK